MPQLARRSRHIVIAVAAVSTVGLVLAGCSSGTDAASDTASPSAQPTQSATPAGTPVAFKTTVTSVRSWTDVVGKKDADQQTYGFNVLEGSTRINDVYVKVRNLGTVDYTNGSGKFGGFVELVWNDGTTLGMRQNGTATFDENKEKTTFEADLDVIEGSGTTAGTTGSGKWTGTRKTSLGGSVTMNGIVKSGCSLNHSSESPQTIPESVSLSSAPSAS
ncbi:MAG: hypothetical protein HQ526_04180, partial [Actinobacteria bacterium]|nr:hypothetical protein [Actinomycetota bacterium]